MRREIINISSIGAINPPKHSIHYNSAKAGVLGFTYDLAYTVAPFNINVNAIIPGLIQTEFYNHIAGLTTDKEKNAFFKAMGKMVPLQRHRNPSGYCWSRIVFSLGSWRVCHGYKHTGFGRITLDATEYFIKQVSHAKIGLPSTLVDVNLLTQSIYCRIKVRT